MNRLQLQCLNILFGLMLVGAALPSFASAPIKALYLTNYSSFWHNYEEQVGLLREGLSRYANVEITLVGKRESDVLETMKRDGFAQGYDVIVYNLCLADKDDLQMIDNAISQTRDLGIPALLMHCTMHSFQKTSPHQGWWNRWRLSRLERRWEADNGDAPFPYWGRFTGVDTLRHDWARSLEMRKAGLHPIVASLPETWETSKDELYRNIEVAGDVEPLYVSYSRATRKDHVVAWTRQVGAGQIVATTLGHDKNTVDNNTFHHFLGNALLWLTGNLSEEGYPLAGLEGNESFKNYQNTVTCNPSDIYEPATIEEVQEAVRRAASEGRQLKVVSLPESNSNSRFICPDQGGILINVFKMNQVLSLDVDEKRVTVQPGIRLVQLSRYLNDHGLAITSMPDYTGVSVAGGMATGAHHSSLQFDSSIAGMAAEIKLVDGEGNLRVFAGDDVHQVAVNMGMLGIVVEVTLNVVEQFKLQYGSERGSDRYLEEDLIDMVAAHKYARVMWFAGNGRYVLDYYNEVDMDTPGQSQHNLWSSTGSVFKFVGDAPYQVINGLPQRAQCDSALLRSLAWFPPIAAKESGFFKPVGISHEVLGSYCENGTCPWDNNRVKSRTMEVAFPVSQVKEWMTDVRAILDENRGCFPILGIYLRFMKASEHWMGLNYGEDVLAFEIHVPKVNNESMFEKSAAVYDEIVQMTLQKYNGRPHWGKNSSPIFVGIGPDQYERWDDFMNLKAELDPQGRFENKIWRQLMGNENIQSFQGCVLSRDCICTQDSDCGDGYRCEEGGHWLAARVCRR